MLHLADQRMPAPSCKTQRILFLQLTVSTRLRLFCSNVAKCKASDCTIKAGEWCLVYRITIIYSPASNGLLRSGTKCVPLVAVISRKRMTFANAWVVFRLRENNKKLKNRQFLMRTAFCLSKIFFWPTNNCNSTKQQPISLPDPLMESSSCR